ncbi:PhnD/SsuA/transferrin family substrate-binding protein [Mycoplasma sp. 2704]|uniref:ABC transporter thiamine pyrophosphate-binding lipoprotein p37/Cypl n=1 Tax=Mycoplasma sp. 2704 TaxID=3108529 RepID=UPI002B1DED78|nr:hypothetical protein [Mycoplasma sp. 2704]MEA4134694.1 PhnD/SsuA/transferrin family substrate-binding protein [Mycoplasma sp. 2704]
MKIKSKSLLFGASLLALTTLPAVAGQCSFAREDEKVTTYTLSLIKPYGIENADTYKTELNNLFNSEIQKIDKSIKLNIKLVEDDSYNVAKDELLKGETDLAFINSGTLLSKKDEFISENLSVALQTLTKQFKGDIKDATYSKDSGASLMTIAASENMYFKQKDWGNGWNQPEGEWAESYYPRFYSDELVPYQRGLIAIVATRTMADEIIKAWKTKDLEKFVSYGIGIGKSSSGSKYLLPEALFAKNFNTETNKPFVSLDQLRVTYSDKIKQAKLTEASTQAHANIHIFFDNEGSYSYTKYKDSKKFSYKVNPEVRPGEGDQQQDIYFLTVTDPLPYNVGVYSSRVSDKAKKAINSVFKSLSEQNKDIWGPKNGFYGYKSIDNEQTEYWNKLSEI